MSLKENKEILEKIIDIKELEEKLKEFNKDDECFEKHYKKYINKIKKYNENLDRIKNIKEYEENKKKEYDYVIGIDEVGRGPLAGPVVATACVMQSDSFILEVNDSKKISEEVRESIFETIKKESQLYGIGMVDASTIDKVNILNATFLAMKEAYEKLNIPNSKKVLILIDGNKTNPYIKGDNIIQEAIIKGDSKSYSIACSSIIAKVTRDRIMNDLDKVYPEYDFINNKGYGTTKHIEALKSNGIIDGLHRLTFVKTL